MSGCVFRVASHAGLVREMKDFNNNWADNFEDLPPLRDLPTLPPPTFKLESHGFSPSERDSSEGSSVCTSEWSNAYTIGNTTGQQTRLATANNENLAPEAAQVVAPAGITITDLIGSGLGSKVFLATGAQGWVAVKAIGGERTCNQSELDLLNKIKHPNIVQMFGVFQGPPLCYVLEYCMGGDLFQALHARIKGQQNLACPLSPRSQASIACDVACALAYIHTEGIIHRDIKSPNVLLGHPVVDTTSNPVAKLADFGLTKVSEEENTVGVGTVRWMAPDLMKETYGTSADVYSFGILLWETFSRKIPFANHKSDPRLFLKVCFEDLRPDTSQCYAVSSEILDLMPKCWAKDAASRPSMKQVHTILCAQVDKMRDLPSLEDDTESCDSQDASSKSVDLDASSKPANLDICNTDIVPPSKESQEACTSDGLSQQHNVVCSCFHGLLLYLKRADS